MEFTKKLYVDQVEVICDSIHQPNPMIHTYPNHHHNKAGKNKIVFWSKFQILGYQSFEPNESHESQEQSCIPMHVNDLCLAPPKKISPHVSFLWIMLS